jgi:hypothetical protein
MSRAQAEAIDLLAFASALPREYRKLKSLIERLSSAHSIHADLAIAHDMLTALEIAQAQADEATKHGAGRTWQADASLALLNSVIILYSRATKTSSRHRGSIAFLKEFSASETEAHEHLCRLRNDAIAHFGPGATLGGQSWHVEKVFVPLDNPERLKIMTASRRLIKQAQVQAMARTQVERAVEISLRTTRERNSAVVEELNRLINDPMIREIAARHQCDLVEFFGSEEEARRVLARRHGSATGVLPH